MNIGPERDNARRRVLCRRGCVLFLATAFALTEAAVGYAASVTLEWDANADTLTAGYYVYYGSESGNYSGNVDVGKSTSAIVNLSDSATTYYFAVQAYSSTGQRSPFSSELVWKAAEISSQTPTLRNPGSMTAVVGQSVTLQLSASDPAGRTLTYSANGLPAGLNLSSATGFISGTPTVAAVYNVTIGVTNTSNLSASQNFTWTILTQPSTPAPGGTFPGGGVGSGSGGGSGTGGGSTVSPIGGGGGIGTGGGTGTGGGGGTGIPSGGGIDLGTGTGSGSPSDGSGTVTGPTVPAPDVTPPVVNIISPATQDGSYRTTSGKVIVTGAASDNIGIVSVTWSSSRGGGGSALGTSSWVTPPIDLQMGDNVITVTAADAAGNVRSASVTVTRYVYRFNHLN